MNSSTTATGVVRTGPYPELTPMAILVGYFLGLQSYADVMSAFAAGERYISRVWSASTDGYVDEARNYLNRATEQFIEARALFAELQQQYRSEFSTA
jgi:hypothetical protein